jgi:hypothetical protein
MNNIKSYGPPDVARSEVVCLCGSTRFWEEFVHQARELTLQGKIVLTPHVVSTQDSVAILPTEQKRMLNELHLRKIDMCDVVLVLNVNRYVGESTLREIEYAREHGKRIKWLHDVLDEECRPC